MSYRRQIKYDYKIQLSHEKPNLIQRLKPLMFTLVFAICGSAAWYFWPEPQTQDISQLVPPAELPEPAKSDASSIYKESQPQLTEVPLPLPLEEVSSSSANADAIPTLAVSERLENPTPVEQEPIISAESPDVEAEENPSNFSSADEQPWETVIVQSGDNMAHIFKRTGLSATELYNILESGKETEILKRLKPGQELRFRITDNRLQEMEYIQSATKTLKVTRIENGYKSVMIEIIPVSNITTSRGIISDSLFLAGQRAGISDNTLMQLTQIFGWDIDFILDIRKGDQFSVIYEELFVNGKKYRNGNILAAEFINRNKTFRAIRYKDSDGYADYYNENGDSMRKAFLRTPVRFSRISSKFNLKRKHPVLNRIRAHKGVDYAAPSGTPVKTAGNGKVVFAGRKGGYGNTVIIQHGERYSTLYAHLSKYRGGIKRGKRVKQGDIIAYVGKTGLATGPHLHYEFRVNGVHRNPLTVKLPKALPIAKKYLTDFKQSAKPWLLQLELLNTGNTDKKAIAEQHAKVSATNSEQAPTL